METIQNYRQNDYEVRFLKGLKEKYNGVRSQIMLIDPLPRINKVFSLLTQQERQMSVKIVGSQALVNAANGNLFGSGARGRGMQGRGRNSAIGISRRGTIGKG